jgi:predicted RecB family nuclease
MIPLPDGTFRFSPRDLVAYLEGDFSAWCERTQAERGLAGGAGSAELAWVTPDEGDQEAELAARMGDAHERRYLERVRTQYPTIVELDRADPEGPLRTLAAMDAGAPVIYQAHLVADGWGGYPDFLYRCAGNGCACGGWHYTPWDTKLARSAKPGFLLQLCAYADFLQAMRGHRPEEVVFVFGHGEERPFTTDRYFYYYRRLRRAFLDFQRHWSLDSPPDPGLDRSWGRWEKTADLILARSDHLSRVANISRGQVRRLEEAGVATLTALAGSGPERRPHRISEPVFDRLRHQARLQRESFGYPQPLWQHRLPVPEEPRRGLAQLPPSSDGDVFLDLEGFPYALDGLEYLFGAWTVDEITPVYKDWWAHDEREERLAFEGFMDWITGRRRRWPDLHVYHYAAYEVTALKRLMGKYATREKEMDDLLRTGAFVDLYRVVQQGFVIGTPSYSLKEIEHLYMPERTGPVLSAGGSVVEYQRWIDSGQPRACGESSILNGIREYNRVDCESTWMLRSWLRDRQRETGIDYLPDPLRNGKPPQPDPARDAAEALSWRLVERGRAREEAQPKEGALDQLVGWLVEFHRREEKPMWWRRFDRHEATIEELFDDRDCLAGLTRTERPTWKIARSQGFEYRYDTTQETRRHAGDKCLVAGREYRAEIVAMDEEAGTVELKSTSPLPDKLSLIPQEHVDAKEIKAAIARYASAWERGEVASQAVDDLLRRRAPRIAGHDSRVLVGAGETPLERLVALAPRLQQSTLCIQGPPGTGKTYTAAAVIVELLRRGHRVGVTAQSHKVILNLVDDVLEAMARQGVSAPVYKVTGSDEEPLPQGSPIQPIESGDTAGILGDGAVLVGGTAWAFSREALGGRLDYVVIDEAGQFSLANAVAVGLSTRNLILVGDQMQLAQVTQGHHPGDTGRSCLEYYLDGQSTIAGDRGVFLDETRRMHPDLCRFVSDAVYESRLRSIPETTRHRVLRAADTALVPKETGLAWVPVGHDDCTQSSEEECDAIDRIVDELLGRRVVDHTGIERPMTRDDILIVAPFNLQVRCLRERLPGIRIGSVDKFQGQEAPVVIVSLCASTLDEAPRGATFLLSPNRLNVAVSRAQAMAIVVGSPALLDVRVRSVPEMELVNLLCHLVEYAEGRA